MIGVFVQVNNNSHMARAFPVGYIIDGNGCWQWVGSGAFGYGRIKVGNRSFQAHRYVYESEKGPIPDGMDLDHLCRNRGCVNPSHLEPVTNRTNVLRGVGISAKNASKEYCRHGHPLVGTNVRHYKGHRICRTCERGRFHRRQQRSAAKT